MRAGQERSIRLFSLKMQPQNIKLISILSKHIGVISLILFYVCFSSCKRETKTNRVKAQSLLDGLYEYSHESDGSIYKYVWIFADEKLYMLHDAMGKYVDEVLGIGYDTPSAFYLEGNKLFICGTGKNHIPLPVLDCKGKNIEPAYEILKVDTLYDGHTNRQVIILKSFLGKQKSELKKVFYDTIQREINDGQLDFFQMIDSLKRNPQ